MAGTDAGAARVIVQRIAVSWSPDARGAAAAAERARLPEAFPVPATPAVPGAEESGGVILLHDVRLRDVRGYRPEETVTAGRAADRPWRQGVLASWGLRLVEEGGRLHVHRTSAGDAFPQRWPRPLCVLEPGRIARYRANFRFVSLSHMSGWRYAQWTLTVGYRIAGPAASGAFARATAAVDVDDRVSLYGNGRGRRPARPRRRSRG
ncbi:hypothetical protein [Marinactinospora rubrisoli]|uniref:Uncharacterized protein n=1 Tax=Marinactinospora rubrisoli TaxID=2715399 RepID=A0ABW2KH06_9ACTN